MAAASERLSLNEAGGLGNRADQNAKVKISFGVRRNNGAA